MGYKVKVKSSASEGVVMVPNLGSFVPNEWTDVSDGAVSRYESIRGRSIEEEAGLEVKKNSPEVKKSSRKKESE